MDLMLLGGAFCVTCARRCAWPAPHDGWQQGV